MTIENATMVDSVLRRTRDAFRAPGRVLAFLGCSAVMFAATACDSPTQPSRRDETVATTASAPATADSAAPAATATDSPTATKGDNSSGDAGSAIPPAASGARVAAQGPIPGVPAPLRLVQVAESYVSMLVHPQKCNCKIFAQNVTTESSGGRINLPTTASAPNQFRWNMPKPYVIHVATSENPPPSPVGPYPSLNAARQGDIIQMKPRTSGLEHTAIVAATDGVGARLVEANYTGCTVTNHRYVTFAALNASHRWTLYRIY